MCNISELLPLVEHLQALDEQSLPSAKVELADLGVWTFSRKLSRTHRVCDWSLEVLRVPLSRILLALLLRVLLLILGSARGTTTSLRWSWLLEPREQELSRKLA